MNIFTKRNKVNVLILIICNAIFVNVNAQEVSCWYTKSSGTISLWNARNNPGPGTYEVNIVEKNDLRNNISVTTNGAIINVGSNYATHDQNFTCALSNSGTSGSSNSDNSTNEIGCWYTKSSGTE